MLKAIVKLVVNLLFKVSVKGNKDVFNNEKTLIVANHESFLDGLVLGLNLPVAATFVAHTEVVKNPLFKLFLRFVDHLSIDPSNPMNMKTIIRLVETGKPVVIFPEGRITVTGSLMKVYEGAGFVAAKTGATVVPVRLDGPAISFFSRLAGIYPRKLFPKITMNIQPPRKIELPTEGTAKQKRRKAGEAMRHILLDMLVNTTPQKTLFNAFLDARDCFGSDYKLVEDIRQVEESYGSLTKTILVIQRMMRSRTEENEIVGVLMPNAAPTLAMLLALNSIKRVPAMLNYTAGREGLLAACIAAGIKQIFASRAFLEKGKLAEIVEGLDGVKVHYLEDLKGQFGLMDKFWVMRHLPCARSTQVLARPEDPAVVIFTSGSEGKPKGVVHSNASILANITQVRAVADFNPLDKFMLALPLFHSFGLLGSLLPLISGCKVFLYPSPLHYRVIPEVVYDRNCTVLFGTSTFLGSYAKYAHPYDFGRLRYVIAGAEKLSEAVRSTWIDKFGIRILEGYGVTECAPVVAVNTPMASQKGTVGQLLPGIEYELEPVPGIDHGGILNVKGPNVMLGYLRYENPGVIEPPVANDKAGWYATGDVVSVNDEGFVTIQGRVKRFAKIAGEMVSLEVVEKLALTVSQAGFHAASTKPDASKGEAIVLFSTDKEVTRDKLQQAAKELGVPELAIPRDIRLIDAIPVLGTGKTNYMALKALAEAA